MKMFRLDFTLLAIGIISLAAAACTRAADTPPPIYLVLLRAPDQRDAKQEDIQVEKIIDLLSGSNDAASVDLPPAFIDQTSQKFAAELRAAAAKDNRPTNAQPTFASFVFAPTATGEAAKPSEISFSAFNELMNHTAEIRVMGQSGAVSTFGADLGRSAMFISYYALSLPKGTSEERETVVNAEIQRCTANVQNAEILSRANLSTSEQTIIEFTCKSPRNRSLTIRTRYLCNDRVMLALNATTTDGQSDEDAKAFDKLFEAFRFR